jgi:hypothetical protein
MFQTGSAHMTDISLDQMKFSCNGQQHIVAFDPPMKSLREARERVVQMDKEALKVLGRDDIAITRYIPPYVKLGHLWNFTQCLLSYIFLPWPSNFKPGSVLYESLFYIFPTVSSYIAQISWIVFAIMLPIHIFETALMIKKLAKHSLTPFDTMWWPWTASCFVEGITSFWRLDGLIEEKRKEKEAKKH